MRREAGSPKILVSKLIILLVLVLTKRHVGSGNEIEPLSPGPSPQRFRRGEGPWDLGMRLKFPPLARDWKQAYDPCTASVAFTISRTESTRARCTEFGKRAYPVARWGGAYTLPDCRNGCRNDFAIVVAILQWQILKCLTIISRLRFGQSGGKVYKRR